MSELDKIIDDYDGSVGKSLRAKARVKTLMLEIYSKALKGETISEMGEIFRKEVREL